MNGELGRLLSCQYRAFRNDDPNPVQQKAIPAYILIVVAMRSCEYLIVPQAGKRRTYILRFRNVRCFRKVRELSDNNPWLEYVDCVSITFEWQKKDKRMDIVTQMASGNLLLCFVCQWAVAVRRIRGYPRATDKTPV